MKKGPWVKLWRNVLGDEKISFLMRRYGHETFTFWIGLLAHSEDGVLLEDEEVFADACQLEEKRYLEIRGIFLKYHLVEEDEQKHLVIKNWDEYQLSDSTERVRRWREKQKPDETLPKRECNEGVTTEGEVEGEVEGEEEKEGEDACAHEDPPIPTTEAEGQPHDSEPSGSPPHFQIAFHWYSRYTKATARPIAPSERDHLRGLELWRRLGGDLSLVDQAIGIYFDRWSELWFARKGKKAPFTPDFSFGAFCGHIEEILALQSPAAAAPSWREQTGYREEAI